MPQTQLPFFPEGVSLQGKSEAKGSAARYAFMREWRIEYPVEVMARVLDVSCSGFYAWLGRPPPPNTVEISRHSGMDRRNPDCMDAPNPRRPWSLGSGAPCRNDGEILKSTALLGWGAGWKMSGDFDKPSK